MDTLVSGHPGHTFLLQTACELTENHPSLFSYRRTLAIGPLHLIARHVDQVDGGAGRGDPERLLAIHLVSDHVVGLEQRPHTRAAQDLPHLETDKLIQSSHIHSASFDEIELKVCIEWLYITSSMSVASSLSETSTYVSAVRPSLSLSQASLGGCL